MRLLILYITPIYLCKSLVADAYHLVSIISADNFRYEFRTLVDVCQASPLFQEEVAKFELPKGFEVIIEPWPYGGPDRDEENRRYFQGLCFAQDQSSGNPDSNFYAYPLPIIPVMDARKREIIRIDKLATGGKQDALRDQTHSKKVINHCKPAEYAPEFLKDRLRKDLKPLNVIQPEGVSFKISGHLVEWQKWRFRLGFNPREGATLHDITYDGRPIFYRLSMSEMVGPLDLPSLVKLTLSRPSPTPTLDRPTLANKPSTSATAASAIAPTT